MSSNDRIPPILDHTLAHPSAFTALELMEGVRRTRGVVNESVPSVCILEFDGDLTDWLVKEQTVRPFPAWACFHTSMFALELEGVTCGIIARTIGGPYSVLIAEQLQAAGAKLIVGLISAGRVRPELPLPCLVVAASAVRDEGTSYHYLPPAREVACPTPIISSLERELKQTGRQVFSGEVWTTDAPYRETRVQLEKWAAERVLAVEMQAASLFAFGTARGASVACVAMVSNAVATWENSSIRVQCSMGLEFCKRSLEQAGHSSVLAERSGVPNGTTADLRIFQHKGPNVRSSTGQPVIRW